MFSIRCSLILMLVSLHYNYSIAQGKIIDSSAINSWPVMSSEAISSDGKFVGYIVRTGKSGGTYYVTDSADRKAFTFNNVSKSEFSDDGKFSVFWKYGDSLGVCDLAHEATFYYTDVLTAKVAHGQGTMSYVAILKKSPRNLLELHTFTGNSIISLPEVVDFYFNDFGNELIFITQDSTDHGKSVLNILDLKTLSFKSVYRGGTISNVVFSFDGRLMTYLTEDKTTVPSNKTLRICEIGSTKDEQLFNFVVNGSQKLVIEKRPPFFDSLGTKLFFYIKVANENRFNGDLHKNGIDIWNSQDDRLVSKNKRALLKNGYNYLAVIQLNKDNSFFRIQNDGDGECFLPLGAKGNLLIIKSGGKGLEINQFGHHEMLPNLYLESIDNGERKLIKEHISSINIMFSPERRYIIWFDCEKKQWFSYNIASERICEISSKIPFQLIKKESYPKLPNAEGVATWTALDKSVIIYDNFDLWELDPDAESAPRNITKMYGRDHDICFRILQGTPCDISSISNDDTLILSAFDVKTKMNGFFRLILEKASFQLKKISMDSAVYYYYPRYSYAIPDIAPLFHPLKARRANVYLLKIMRADKFPNLFISKDLKIYKPITKLSPERSYNWMSTRLFRYSVDSTILTEGILYTPQRINSELKSPLIIYIYEKNADALNHFVNPAFSTGPINIPYFVSRGYCVFIPDIEYRQGFPGQSALKFVLSGVKALSKETWFDETKIGIWGHSFGGWEVNYIVSHSNIFDAAISGAGLCDITSMYSDLSNGESAHFYYETTQGRMGGAPWTISPLYVDNSPIYNADRVETPILILHNKDDDAVPWNTQGVAWFTALKSLNKKAWMLQYKGERHVISDIEYQQDYTKRALEFFDHFLRGSDIPDWMKPY